MSVLSANCEFATLLISRLQRMAGLTGRTAARRSVGEWPVRAVSANLRVPDLLDAAVHPMAATSPE